MCVTRRQGITNLEKFREIVLAVFFQYHLLGLGEDDGEGGHGVILMDLRKLTVGSVEDYDSKNGYKRSVESNSRQLRQRRFDFIKKSSSG